MKPKLCPEGAQGYRADWEIARPDGRRWSCAAKHGFILLLFFGIGLRAAQDPGGCDPEKIVSFKNDIAPILAAKCLNCHGDDRMKGGYSVSSFVRLMRPGDSENKPVCAGDPESSELYRRLTESNEDDRMPQKDDPLPPDQIDLVNRWITQGAHFDGRDRELRLAKLIPRAAHPDPPQVYSVPIPIAALAFDPRGEKLAIGGYHEITIWNPSNGRLIRRIPNVPQRVYSLAYHPDGELIAAGGGSPGMTGEIGLYDVGEGTVAGVLGTMTDVALSLNFCADGTVLAVGGADACIRIYDVGRKRERNVIRQHADWVMAVAFDATGTQVASASRDRTARVYRADDGELVSSFTGHEMPVFEVAFTNHGSEVVSSGRDGKVHFWKVKDGKRVRQISGIPGEVTRLLVAEDSLFVGSTDHQLREYSVGNRKLKKTFGGHQDWISGLAYDPANQRLASGSHDGEVRIWNAVDGELISSFTAAPGYVVPSE